MRLASAVQKAPKLMICTSLAVTSTAKLEVKGRTIMMAWGRGIPSNIAYMSDSLISTENYSLTPVMQMVIQRKISLAPSLFRYSLKTKLVARLPIM